MRAIGKDDMARAKAMRAVAQEDARLAKANRVAKEAIRIVGLIKVIATLPRGPMRERLKAEVEGQIAALRDQAA